MGRNIYHHIQGLYPSNRTAFGTIRVTKINDTYTRKRAAEKNTCRARMITRKCDVVVFAYMCVHGRLCNVLILEVDVG